MKDSIVEAVVKKFNDRKELGFKKYGKTLDRNDLTDLAWINHAQEEAMDMILYLEKMKQNLQPKKCNRCGNETQTKYDGYWCKLCKHEM